tara:strand:+ start:562 stop:744 length:183 start_codon:yes stop_codon:yes gene_type:complete
MINDKIQKISNKCIKEINTEIDRVIHWQLEADDIKGDELYDLELNIKQQILFTLIKQVTK